jgi:plastocyanin
LKAKSTLISVAVLGIMSILGANAIAGAKEPVAQAAAPFKVRIGDNFFNPVKAKVRPGGKVKWTNNGKVEHNVTFPRGFKSGNLVPGDSAVAKFNRAGRFPYSCTIHSGMNGKVRVVAG